MRSISFFDIEESDIAKLVGDGASADGWVNVGTHAVKIENSYGRLTVEVHARTAEGTILAAVTVEKDESIQAGGVDPDETEEE